MVVAIDPAVTSGEEADETGIIVAGKDHNGHGYVLADLSGRYPPIEWARFYGKPPRHTRFTKGQSGNPRGRVPGAKNLKTLLIDALNELVVVTENGGRRTISKGQAIIKQIVNQSAKGDWRAAKLLLDTLHESEGRAEPETSESSFAAADQKVIEQLKARLRGRKGESDD